MIIWQSSLLTVSSHCHLEGTPAVCAAVAYASVHAHSRLRHTSVPNHALRKRSVMRLQLKPSTLTACPRYAGSSHLGYLGVDACVRLSADNDSSSEPVLIAQLPERRPASLGARTKPHKYKGSPHKCCMDFCVSWAVDAKCQVSGFNCRWLCACCKCYPG